MILFVGDELRGTDSYVQELNFSGHEVKVAKDVDLAMTILLEAPSSVELLILDVMMPPGRAFRNARTLFGLRTGVFFFDEIRSLRPDLPILVFTNVTEHAVRARFQGLEACWFMEKWRYLPIDFAREVKRILFETRAKSKG